MDDISMGLSLNEEHVNASFLTPAGAPGAAPPPTEATAVTAAPMTEEQQAPPQRAAPQGANPFAAPVSMSAPTPAPAVATGGPDVDCLRVSHQCKATKCFRLQWEAEMNPRCARKTTIGMDGGIYIFDGFYLLCHGDPPAVPQFEYTRGGVMCKLHFIPEDLPSSARGNDPHEFCQSLFMLQRYLFQQLLNIQPGHLFRQIFPDPEHATGDPSTICGDYHLVPRFLAVNEEPLLHRDDLNSPNRVGFAVGRVLAVKKVLDYLEASSKCTVPAFLSEFDHHQLVDCVVSTRLNGQPGVFRVDELITEPWDPREGEKEAESDKKASADAKEPASPRVVTKDKRHVVRGMRYRGASARNFDGAKTRKKVRKWQEQGVFLQLSPEVEPRTEQLNPFQCHLTGMRTDIFEVGSAMPMVLKYVRHFNLLASFESSMGLSFHDKSLLRQAFTHGSYVDVGMQNVNTVEATHSRVRLGHVFENVASLKRSRSALLDGDDALAGNTTAKKLKRLAEQHLSGDFNEEFHSKFLCPYERLEFLGDAVLGFLVASSAFLKLPNADEGFLHQTRVDIVNNDNLGKMAKAANFESLLLTAFDLAKLKEETKAKITADCFEALLGALYKDQGIIPCRALLGKLMDMHDAELRELCFLSTPELLKEAKAYIEIDRAAIQEWSKLTHTRLLHRRFAARTSVDISNVHLWLQAMTHHSFQKPQIDEDEFIGHDPSYERIEFLGDAVLQLLSSEFLVDAFPYHQEHLLTQARSSLVKNTKLAIVARQAGYEEFIRLGNQVKQSGNLYVEDVLADVFEATLGAVYLEAPGELDHVRAILERSLFPRITEAIRRRQWMNPRKVLAHYVSQWSRNSVRPILCRFKNIKAPTPPSAGVLVPKEKENGSANGNGKAKGDPPAHAVALYVNNFQVARAVGRTIHAAQDAACKHALKLYGVKLHDD